MGIAPTESKTFSIRAAMILSCSALGACATLPSSGPTGKQIRSSITAPTTPENYRLVELKSIADLPPVPARSPDFSSDYVPSRATDLIGPGDILDIAIYESGISLFGGSTNAAAAAAAGFDPSSKVEHLPPARVNDNGTVQIPYVGQVMVSGRTTAEAQAMIRHSLRGLSENPQVLVAIREGTVNTVIVGGEVGKPGRLVLPAQRASLSDVIALAGGQRGNVKDITVRVQRGDATTELRLSDILGMPQNDVVVYPGDRISVYTMPRSFSVMGAAGKAQQISFSGPTVSLAEALAMSGGVNPDTGDSKAIFVFRYAVDEQSIPKPIVYHLNMMNGGAYFVAQRFAMQDKDVLYVGNAEANQPSKFVQIISQLFTPLVIARSVSGI